MCSVLIAALLWLATVSSALELPCHLLAALLAATHSAYTLLGNVSVIEDDLTWTLRRPAELRPGARVKILEEQCCRCRVQTYGVLLRKIDADDMKNQRKAAVESRSWWQSPVTVSKEQWWVQIGGEEHVVPSAHLFARDDTVVAAAWVLQFACVIGGVRVLME